MEKQFPTETLTKIRTEYAQLAKLDKAALKNLVARSRKVADLRGLSKDELISMALRDTHGNARVNAAFAQDSK